MENNIGFVVWGIRNGFKNNWLSFNVDMNVYEFFTDDMRQICNSTVDKFFSIEKIEDSTILSIYNPNTRDHVQRKAYIALSIVIPNGFKIIGDTIGCLDQMMQTYEIKQGNAMVNMVNVDDIKTILTRIQVVRASSELSTSVSNIGLFQYNDLNQISAHFSNPTIYDFKKVFFISGQNIAIERIPGIQIVHSFAKPLVLTINEFDTRAYKVTINNQPIANLQSQVKRGDLIQFIDLKTGQGKQLQVADSDIHISLLDLFPPIIFQPSHPKSPKSNKPKILVLLSLSLLLVLGVFYFFQADSTVVGGPEGGEGPQSNSLPFSATYDFEQLELTDFPSETNESTQFYIYKLNNDSIALDSIFKTSPTSMKLQLKKVSDTMLVIRYKLDDSLYLQKIPVKFILPKKYTIKPNESLSKIAERFGIKKDSLMKWNKIASENKIQANTEIVLRPKQASATEEDNHVELNTDGSNLDHNPNEPPQKQPKPQPNIKDESKNINQLKDEIKKLIDVLKNPADKLYFRDELDGKSKKDELIALKKEINSKIIKNE
jgi:LysM repeat protein